MLKGRYREFAKIVVITVFFLIVATFIAAFIGFQIKEQQAQEDSKKLQELYPNILEGASTGPNTVTVDYSKPIAKGSPLIFGGSHNPNVEHQDAWDGIQEIGITSIRKDLFTERAIPNTTIEDYKNNKNGVADIDNWNQKELQIIKDIFINAKKRNMTTIGILAYAPGWLTYTNTGNGVPKDWEVFKDIAKKSYIIHRDNLDYLEIWNEPSFDYFFNTEGSGLSREDAYKKMFEVAVEAIREVDKEINDGKRIKIGGPVSHTPRETSVLEPILKDSELKKELDFISYHNYDFEHLEEPSDILFRSLMEDYDVNHLPVFITEWNYRPNNSKAEPRNTGIDGILYVGNKFTGFLKMNLAGANYHVLEPKQPTKKPFYGFYTVENDISILEPQANTWRLFSKQMGLGKGSSEIFEVANETTSEEDVNSIGFKNINNGYGITFVNNSIEPQLVEISLKNLNIKNFARVKIFVTSEDYDSKEPIYEGLIKSENQKITFDYYIPKKAIIGVIINEDIEWYDRLKIF